MTEAGRELTAELITDAAVPMAPVISPDGRWVAYVVTAGISSPRTGTLWAAAAGAGSPPRRLAAGVAADPPPRWAPDSASVVFVAGGQVCRAGLAGGAAEVLLSWRGEISGVLPLAGGRLIAVVARDEPATEADGSQAGRGDARVWGEPAPGDRLRLLDPGTGRLTVVAGLRGRHVTEVAERPGGGALAVISWDRPEEEPGAFTARLHVADPATGQARDRGSCGLAARSPVWWRADSGWQVAYLAVTPPSPAGGTAVFAVAADGAAPGHRNLTAGMTSCPAELAQTGGGPPLGLFASGLDTALQRLDPATARFRCITTWPGLADQLTVSSQGEHIAVRRSTAYQPVDVHAGPAGARLARLSESRPEYHGIRWGAQERFSYRAADGLRLDGLLVRPAGSGPDDGPFPLITLVHGGPYDRWADAFMGNWFSSLGQWLAAAGYAVFLPNPRGSQGRGHEFAVAVAGAVGTGEWTDILTGIDQLIADGIADPGRLGISGWSHGGFMAAWAVGQTTRFRAALMGAGISDWGLQVAAGELGTQEAALSGSCGWEGPGPHRHDQLSPISYASRIQTPVLILHGERDTNVPVGQAVYFQRALAHFGVPHELVIYPGEGHTITGRGHQLDVLHRARAWFGRWLGDP